MRSIRFWGTRGSLPVALTTAGVRDKLAGALHRANGRTFESDEAIRRYVEDLPFDIGGTIHIVVNNQVGFTTSPGEARSARFPTDIARLIEAPVAHVNGDDPDAVYRVARVAAAGLAGIAVKAGCVLIGDRERLPTLADASGLFIEGVA